MLFFLFSLFSQSRLHLLCKKSFFTSSDILVRPFTRTLNFSNSPSIKLVAIFKLKFFLVLSNKANLSWMSLQLSQTLLGNPKGPVELGTRLPALLQRWYSGMLKASISFAGARKSVVALRNRMTSQTKVIALLQ